MGPSSHPANCFALLFGKLLAHSSTEPAFVDASRLLVVPRLARSIIINSRSSFLNTYVFALGTIRGPAFSLGAGFSGLPVSVSETVLDNARRFIIM
jgi:hypothetical protein